MQSNDVFSIPAAGVSPTSPAAPEPSGELGREDFLLMLIAQLENQDPLNPQDSTEFTAQLAQFTSLDQMLAMRTSLDSLVAAQANTQSLSVASLIGREVLVSGSHFGVSADVSAPPPQLFAALDAPTEILGAEIRDAAGRVVARAGGMGTLPAGRSALEWSRFDRLPGPGTYSLELTAAPGAATPGVAVQARVTGASLAGGEPMLLLDGAQTSLSSLIEVRE